MNRTIILIVMLLGFSLLAAGCSHTQKAAPLRLWAGMEAEYPKLVELCDQFSKQNDIEVELLKVPFKDLRDKFLIAAPAELGPDLVIGPHDWIGVLATAGTLQPIPKSFDFHDFVPVAMEAVTFENQVYAVPLCMESIALLRNQDLMPKRPTTTAELIEMALAAQKANPKVRGFYFEIRDLYFSLPFIIAEGGYLLGKNPDGTTNPLDVGMDNQGAVTAANWLKDLRMKYRLIQAGASENISKTLFIENKAASILNGPWILKDIKASGINYAVDPFPKMDSGAQPKPAVGVQSIMFNARSKHQQDAIKLMEFLASSEPLATLSLTSGRPPVTGESLVKVAHDKDITAYAAIAESGIPLPTHPAAGAIWEPMKGSLELIANGEVETAKELHDTTERIKEKIRLMLE